MNKVEVIDRLIDLAIVLGVGVIVYVHSGSFWLMFAAVMSLNMLNANIRLRGKPL